MSEHMPYVDEVMWMDCVYGDCDHEAEDDCPLMPLVCCRGCMDVALAEDDEAPAIEWPCVFATRRGSVDDKLKARMLAEFSG